MRKCPFQRIQNAFDTSFLHAAKIVLPSGRKVPVEQVGQNKKNFICQEFFLLDPFILRLVESIMSKVLPFLDRLCKKHDASWRFPFSAVTATAECTKRTYQSAVPHYADRWCGVGLFVETDICPLFLPPLLFRSVLHSVPLYSASRPCHHRAAKQK